MRYKVTLQVEIDIFVGEGYASNNSEAIQKASEWIMEQVDTLKGVDIHAVSQDNNEYEAEVLEVE